MLSTGGSQSVRMIKLTYKDGSKIEPFYLSFCLAGWSAKIKGLCFEDLKNFSHFLGVAVNAAPSLDDIWYESKKKNTK